jgi:hypothetical protein
MPRFVALVSSAAALFLASSITAQPAEWASCTGYLCKADTSNPNAARKCVAWPGTAAQADGQVRDGVFDCPMKMTNRRRATIPCMAGTPLKRQPRVGMPAMEYYPPNVIWRSRLSVPIFPDWKPMTSIFTTFNLF